MKHTEYFMEIRELTLHSREKASPSVAHKIVYIYICPFRDCRKLHALKTPENSVSHFAFKDLRLSLRTFCLHYLLTCAAHRVPLFWETFIPMNLLCSGHRIAPGHSVQDISMQLCCVRISCSTHTFICTLINRTCQELIFRVTNEIALDVLPWCSCCCTAGVSLSCSIVAFPAQQCLWRCKEGKCLNAFESLACLFKNLYGS